MESIMIIGGDKRQTCLKDIFTRMGYFCEHINSAERSDLLGRTDKFDVVMLPLPVSKDKEHVYSENRDFKVKIKDITGKLTHSQLLVGGSIDKALAAYLSEKKIPFFDYFGKDDFIIYNAYLTAQGALRLLLENTDEIISSKKALVTGYGRVARAVADMLKNNGINVYVTARNKAQLTEAECAGCKTFHIDKLSYRMFLFDYIFNTVPFNIFTEDEIQHFGGKYFELASKPFGVNKEYFSSRPDDYIDGGALPGKYLPRSSAERIAEITIEHITDRKGGD